MAQASGGDQGGGARAWLFSFVDLAFLMLIAMTILANQNAGAPDLGEIVVPRINEESGKDLGASRGDVWQLRVHPPIEQMNGELEPPFELIVLAGNTATPGIEREAHRTRTRAVRISWMPRVSSRSTGRTSVAL
jgi:hypothetical protein